MTTQTRELLCFVQHFTARYELQAGSVLCEYACLPVDAAGLTDSAEGLCPSPVISLAFLTHLIMHDERVNCFVSEISLLCRVAMLQTYLLLIANVMGCSIVTVCCYFSDFFLHNILFCLSVCVSASLSLSFLSCFSLFFNPTIQKVFKDCLLKISGFPLKKFSSA